MSYIAKSTAITKLMTTSLLGLSAWVLFEIPAQACVVESLQSQKKRSDVVLDGTFVIVDHKNGFGYIVPTNIEKGKRRLRYDVSWDPNGKEGLPASITDCLLTIPRSGTFGIYYLQENRRNFYQMIGRASRVEEKN